MKNIGGKASNLLTLKNAGFRLPEFFILSSEEILNSNLMELEKQIIEKTKSWSGGIILRSSASCEDSKEKSFAGLFESIRLQDKSNVKEALKKVINSVNSKK